MRNVFYFPVVALIAVSLLPQTVSAEPSAGQAPVTVTRNLETEMLTVSAINATVAEYVQALGNAHVAGDCQVFCTHAAKDAVLPTIVNLKCSQLGAAKVLAALTKNSSNPLSAEEISSSGTMENIVVIDVVSNPGGIVSQKEQVHVVNVKAAIRIAGSAEELQTIIETSLSAMQLAKPVLRLKLHAKSCLMFIRGTAEQIEFIEMLLGELYLNELHLDELPEE